MKTALKYAKTTVAKRQKSREPEGQCCGEQRAEKWSTSTQKTQWTCVPALLTVLVNMRKVRKWSQSHQSIMQPRPVAFVSPQKEHHGNNEQ